MTINVMRKKTNAISRVLLLLLCILPAGGLVTATTPTERADMDAVIVSRGSAKVTFADVDAYVQRIPEKDRAGFMDSSKRIENLLQGLLLQRQLAQAAPEPKPPQPAQQSAVEKLAQEEELSKQTLAVYKKTVSVPDLLPLARETYATHKSEYQEPGRIDVQQVLITTDKRTDEEARKLAFDVEKQAKADPNAFSDLVKKYSEESAKEENQGMVVDAANEKYATELAEAVSNLKHDGEISSLVKTSFGYHVLKLVKRMPGRPKAFDEVRDALLAELTTKFTEQQVQDYINSFTNMTLDANPEFVGSLRDRYMPASSTAASPPEAALPKSAK